MGFRYTRVVRLMQAVLAVAVAAVLAACGAGGNSQPAQTQMVQPRIKEAGTTASDYANEVQQLYVAYFGRPADPTGLANFEQQLLSLGAPTDIGTLAADYATNPALAALIDSFGLSAESQALYGSGTTTQFVATIFSNVLGRQPLASGSAFWVSAIDSGQTSKGDAALSIMAGAYANSTQQGQDDVDLITNRLAVAAAFTGEVSALSAVSSYAGSTAAQDARTLLSQVSSTTDPSSLAQQIITVIENLISAAAQSYAGAFCGTVAGTYSGTANVTLTSNGNGTFTVTGTAVVGGYSIPIQGTTQPPTLNVELVCTSGVCGSVSGTVTATSISGTYSIPGLASGNISLSRSCQ